MHNTGCITFQEFINSVEEFKLGGTSEHLAQDAYNLYKKGVEKSEWKALEDFFNSNNINKASNGVIYPPNDGFIEIVDGVLKKGKKIDRYGGRIDPSTGKFSDRGKFVANQGTPFTNRALPLQAKQSPYKQYIILEDIEVKTGNAIPWFNQKGLGEQHLLPKSIDDLIKEGKIIEL